MTDYEEDYDYDRTDAQKLKTAERQVREQGEVIAALRAEVAEARKQLEATRSMRGFKGALNEIARMAKDAEEWAEHADMVGGSGGETRDTGDALRAIYEHVAGEDAPDDEADQELADAIRKWHGDWQTLVEARAHPKLGFVTELIEVTRNQTAEDIGTFPARTTSADGGEAHEGEAAKRCELYEMVYLLLSGEEMRSQSC